MRLGLGIGIGDVDRRIVSPRKFRSDISDQDFDFKTDHFGPKSLPAPVVRSIKTRGKATELTFTRRAPDLLSADHQL